MASLLSGILLPYLSADFESGDRQRLTKRLRQVVQVVSTLFSGAAIMFLLASPLIFQWMLGGRYDEARQILPLALLQCIWMSLFMLAQNLFVLYREGQTSRTHLARGLDAECSAQLSTDQFVRPGRFGGCYYDCQRHHPALMLNRLAREGQALGWNTWLACFAPTVLALAMVM